MIVVDPTKRTTILNLRQSSWFQTDLPEYLQPLDEVIEHGHDLEIDAGVVDEIFKKTGFSDDTIMHALGEPGNNQIKVAYQLVVDARQMQRAARNGGNYAHLFGISPPPVL